MAANAASGVSNVKITLHWLEVSRAHRILWLLEELGVPYELKTYKRGKDMLADPKLKEIHPLGKSPVVTIEAPASAKPIVLAESGAIAEYLCDHFGKHLIPERYQPGKEGEVGGETESWLRYRYYLHYCEGTIMPLNVMALITDTIRKSPVPFFIRPVTGAIASKLNASYLQPNFESNSQFLEDQLASSPDNGEYLCGKNLTAADILMSFPLEAGKSRSGVMTQERFPKIWAYVDRLHLNAAYKRAVQKIEEVEGGFKTNL